MSVFFRSPSDQVKNKQKRSTLILNACRQMSLLNENATLAKEEIFQKFAVTLGARAVLYVSHEYAIVTWAPYILKRNSHSVSFYVSRTYPMAPWRVFLTEIQQFSEFYEMVCSHAPQGSVCESFTGV